jgi:prevent-host-death family protein
MTTIGFYEARTHFSELLDQVARGKKIVITRHGKPAAILSPPPKETKKDVARIVKDMLSVRDREGPKLGKATIRDLIEEGRRI